MRNKGHGSTWYEPKYPTHTMGPQCISLFDTAGSDNKQNADNSFDYDLCNGRVPPSQDAHAVHGEPIYAAGAGFDPANRTGRFQLALDSPGVGAGQPIPNFSRGYTGEAPDLGAHQRGAPPIQYGVRANQP